MSIAAILFEVGVTGGAAIAGAGIAFILVFAGIALLIYRMLRKTMKWSFRIAVAGVILMIALIGGGIMIWYSMKATPAPARKPEPTRQR